MTALRDKTFFEDEDVMVTVSIVAFNHALYVRDCFEGILDQQCDFRVEIIVHDDASTDGTDDIIREYALKYPTIFRPILQKENQYSKGVNVGFTFILPVSKGAYVAICDGDDYWKDPAKLARQVSVMEAQPNVAVTYGRVRRVDSDGNISAHKGGAERDLTPSKLKSTRGINTLTTCFRNIFRGMPPPMYLRTAPIGDLTLWAMLGYHGGGKFLSDMPHSYYRVHQGGIMSQQSRPRQLFMSTITHFSIAAHHFELGDYNASRNSMQNGLKNILEVGVLSPVALTKFIINSIFLSRKKARPRTSET